MKLFMTATIIALSCSAFAQTSTSNQQLPPTSETAPVTANSINTLSTTANQVKPETAKKFSGNLVIGAYVSVKDLREKGSGSMIDSANTLGLFYAATEKIKVGLGHNFGLRAVGDSSQLADFESDNGPGNGYKTLDPTIHLNYKMNPLFGSAPYAIMSRYYIPVSQESQANKTLGVLRTQAYITWSLNTKVDASFFGQARLYMNSADNKDAARGSDSVLRTIFGPVLAYNFSDQLNVYYNPYLDLKSTGYQRGRFDADTANGLSQEVGVWITLANGNFVINPAWLTNASKLGSDSYDGTGSDANTEYDLNLIAYF